jgi:protein tyrosine phosphatase (PTP) superfamily phosphohydrolase (DUF442 family)
MTDPESIFQWRRRDARVTTSGQPTEAQLADLATLGVDTIVNLGLHDHPRALPDEAASVAALGMTYVHLPVDFDAPSETDLARFREIMAGQAGRTVHVHCIANLRVTAFFYRLDREVGNEAQARSRMESVWRPGGTWARFIGDHAAASGPNRYAGRDC